METNVFKTIRLDEMDKVQLMNRTDRKYWFHSCKLQNLLNTIHNEYFLLEVNGNCLLSYNTTYFDTPDNKMYVSHHNGKLNRMKIRKRSYVDSKISFLEIKFKNNKRRTIKKRILSEFGTNDFSEKEKTFVTAMTTYQINDLQVSLNNNFTRLTLVNKNFKERCTIDIDIRFVHCQRSVKLSDLVIIELKSDGSMKDSHLALALRDQRIRASGFSKYCFGKSVIDPELKRNAFKTKIRKVEKTITPEVKPLNII